MKNHIAWIVLLLSLLLADVASATGYYEDESLRLSISKGWDVLEDGTYAFSGPSPFSADDHPSRIQDAVAKEHSGKLTKSQLQALFQDDYIPIIISTLVKVEADKELCITHLYTTEQSLLMSELRGWEKHDNRITKTIGAYYFLNVPPFLSYEIVFLVPKRFGENPIRATFTATEWFSKTLTVKANNVDSINHRIKVLESEISRLKRFLIE